MTTRKRKNSLYQQLCGAIMLLLINLFCQAQPPTAGTSLASTLQQLRTRDDLSGWIFQQIQYVAKAPASRSSLLIHAVDEAWRHPRTEAEAQAWQDPLINEGYALLLSGAIVPSTDAYTAAYEWASRHPEVADSVSLVEYILKPLG